MNILKRVAISYLISAGVFLLGLYIFKLFVGPDENSMSYNQAFSFHAVVMVFLFIIPAIPAAFSKKK